MAMFLSVTQGVHANESNSVTEKCEVCSSEASKFLVSVSTQTSCGSDNNIKIVRTLSADLIKEPNNKLNKNNLIAEKSMYRRLTIQRVIEDFSLGLPIGPIHPEEN